MSAAEDLARFDREIERIYQEAYAGNPDVHGILLGLHDWRTEKLFIANERSARTESPDSPNSK